MRGAGAAAAEAAVKLDRPWLSFDLGQPMQVLSWAINRPGLVEADRILWREVRNADLPLDLDVESWLNEELRARGATDDVVLLTSRDVRHHHVADAQVEGIRARCLATVGLSNAERVGRRQDRRGMDWGTINLAVRLSCGVTQAALLEAMSIATQARTAAVMEAAWPLEGGIATGTGTDCIAVAAPEGPERFAGLHTAVGEALGAAVFAAVQAGAREWCARPPVAPFAG